MPGVMASPAMLIYHAFSSLTVAEMTYLQDGIANVSFLSSCVMNFTKTVSFESHQVASNSFALICSAMQKISVPSTRQVKRFVQL
eukprot:scaffold118169_cov37-Prasinocladus_malaysianus.AAC.1